MLEPKPRSTAAVDPDELAMIRSMLRRYPQTTPQENELILKFVRKGPIMDRALLSGYDDIQESLSQFTADHKSEFSFSILDWLIAAGIAVTVMLCGYFLWDSAV